MCIRDSHIVSALEVASRDEHSGYDERLTVNLGIQSNGVQMPERVGVYVGRRERGFILVPAAAIIVVMMSRDRGLACGQKCANRNQRNPVGDADGLVKWHRIIPL